MIRPLALFVIGLVFGTGLGAMLAAPATAPHDHASHDHAIGADGYDNLDPNLTTLWPADLPAPTLDVELTTDPKSGANLHVIVDGFVFTPDAVNGDAVAGTGHAHLYINNERIARLYGPWFHLTDVPSGEVVVRVTLNANDHRLWVADGKAVFIEKTVTLP